MEVRGGGHAQRGTDMLIDTGWGGAASVVCLCSCKGIYLEAANGNERDYTTAHQMTFSNIINQ